MQYVRLCPLHFSNLTKISITRGCLNAFNIFVFWNPILADIIKIIHICLVVMHLMYSRCSSFIGVWSWCMRKVCLYHSHCFEISWIFFLFCDAFQNSHAYIYTHSIRYRLVCIHINNVTYVNTYKQPNKQKKFDLLMFICECPEAKSEGSKVMVVVLFMHWNIET